MIVGDKLLCPSVNHELSQTAEYELARICTFLYRPITFGNPGG